MTGKSVDQQRRYPRIDIPLLVEFRHPALGNRRTTAENISAGGLFVNLTEATDAAKIQVQSKIKLRLLNANPIEPQATPTVDMIVTRVEEQGMGLKFANQTSQFLWESAERRRVELAIGRDYFQIHLTALVQHEKQLLLLEERGHWVFPGCYLQVGESWQDASQQLLVQGLGLSEPSPVGPVEIHNQSDPTLPAVATLRVFYQFSSQDSAVNLNQESNYRHFRWVDKIRTLDELTFANPDDRTVVEFQLRRLEKTS